MEAKDVALLGFISSAQEYINKHLYEKDSLVDFKNIDIDRLKKELVNELRYYNGGDRDALLISGKKAFEDYRNEKQGYSESSGVFDFLGEVIFDSNAPQRNSEPDEYGLTDDDAFLQAIQSAASKSDAELLENRNSINQKYNQSNKEALSQVLSSFQKEQPVFYQTGSGSRDARVYNNPGLDYYGTRPKKDLKPKVKVKPKLKERIEPRKQVEEIELVEISEELADQIKEAYPYLGYSFIKSAYANSEYIDKTYQELKAVILLHRVRFYELVDLRQFVEIVMNHDYSVNVDEKKMIVDVFKKFANEQGAILANIFEVANQAYCLKGSYEGYRVIKVKKS